MTVLMRRLVWAFGFWMVLSGQSFGQSDTTNVWFSNGPSGLHDVRTLVVHPQFTDTLYAGTLPGTIFRSLNRGNTWTEVGATSVADSVLALVIAPSDSSVIYAGTLNRGVYKSTDFGTTWSATGFTGRQVNALVVDPLDADKVYAGTPDSLFKTTNGGTAWSFAGLDSVLITSLAIQPQTSDTIYVGTDGDGLYRTLDDGTVWTQINGGLSMRVSALAVHPTQTDTVYAGTFDVSVSRSVDAGASWSASNNGLTASSVTSLAISLTDPNILYAGTSTGQVFKSADNAGIWLDITRNLSAGGSVSTVVVHPDSSNVIYVGVSALSSGVQRLKQVGLGAVSVLAAGVHPEAVAMADLNGDGAIDVIVANSGENDLSVYLNSSQGAVFTRNDFRVGSGPIATRVGDLDGDGDVDLATANAIKQTLSVLFNDSTGVFASPTDLFVGGAPGGLALADLDGDGDLDLTTAGGTGGAALIFLNDGKGSFEAPRTFTTVGGVSDLVANDFSGDGIPDVAFTSASEGVLVVMTSQGNLNFSIDQGTNIGVRPGHLVDSDLDIDGQVDLAVATADAKILVFFNNQGTFDRANPVVYTLNDTASTLVAADLDFDFYPDLLKPRQGGVVEALVNDGNGVFSTTLSYGSISSPGDAAAADLNGDGQLDICVTSPSSSVVTLFANSVAPSIKIPAAPRNVTAADRQGDLGDNVDLTWIRPRVDETTGRAVAYRIFRALSPNGPFSELVRVDTTAAKTVDTTFVHRSFVDSGATLGVTHYYYLASEDNTGALSGQSTIVSAVSKAQPFFDFRFSGNSPYNIGDTIQAIVRLNPLGHDIQSFSLFMNFDSAAVRILDNNTVASGIQPFLVDSSLVQNARILQNRIEPVDSTGIDYGLGFLPTLGEGPVPVGSFRFVTRKNATTQMTVLNDTASVRQTVLASRGDGTIIRPFVLSASTLIFKNFRVQGRVAFQGRSENLNLPVRFDLTQNNSAGTALPDSIVFHPSNDLDMTKNGFQTVLDADGGFLLDQVPPGKFGLFVKAFHYLRGRVSTDSVVVDSLTGVADPVSFQWVSKDSSLIAPELRAGDANDDNRADLADFGILATYFGASGFASESPAWGADFNGDGVVNLADFALLQSNFGEEGLGSAVPAKPALSPARILLVRDAIRDVLRVEGAEHLVGFSADLILSGESDSKVEVEVGSAWGNRKPMVLTRTFKRRGETGVRISMVLPKGVAGFSGEGDLAWLDTPGRQIRLENIQVLDVDGSMAFAAGTPLTVLDRSLGLPIRSELLQNHPNPFNPTTTIPFAVSTPSDVLLIVYSPLGQEVKTLVFEAMEPGYHRVTWDGRDNLGRSVASGIYLYRLVVGDFVDVKKALLVK
ncbi:MAG: FG-GAP-like repeat-containing protein [bacterium]|nr:FG-GAP-like repeat-containing protein [bacterium]